LRYIFYKNLKKYPVFFVGDKYRNENGEITLPTVLFLISYFLILAKESLFPHYLLPNPFIGPKPITGIQRRQ